MQLKKAEGPRSLLFLKVFCAEEGNVFDCT